jgi:hypothetical protein
VAAVEDETMSADWVFTVRLTGDRTLNEKGFDVLADAVEAADLEGALHDAVVEAMARELPKDDQGDERRGPARPMDWYEITVEAT